MAADAGLAGAVAFPLSPVFSAFGLSRLDLLHAYEASADAADFPATLAALRDRALRDMRGEGVDAAQVSLRLEAEVSADGGRVEAVDLGDVTDLVAGAERLRSHAKKLRLIRLKAVVPGRRGELLKSGGGEARAHAKRDVAWSSRAKPTPVYDWDGLQAGATIDGPAIVESRHTTVPLAPGVRARVGELGELVMTVDKR
jgi:N-methylhydantoinase A/oxoprolinase/acetone carboxylase beta subunit